LAAASLDGRSILVTGAAGGIGAAVVGACVDAGAQVIAVDVDEGVTALEDGGVTAVVGDVTDPAVVEHLAASRVDGLVHAAAVLTRVGSIEQVTVEDWQRQADVIARSAFFLVRAVAERMRADGRGGSIVCFSSVSAHHGGLGGTWPYAAANGAVLSLVRGLARTYAPHEIRVNGIAPGAVDTPMMTSGLSVERLDAIVANIPLGRMAQPAEVADVCVFLLGDRSSYVTGVTLDVDGGWITR
jgi:3-oxoacyl-[acyl-carrier protein] reductase